MLKPQETYELSWVLFWHEGEKDFYRKAMKIGEFVHIQAREYTVFPGEKVALTVKSDSSLEDTSIWINGTPVNPVAGEEGLSFEFTPDRTGEYHITLQKGLKKTFSRIMAVPALMDIVERRCRFIVEKQQFIDESSRLNGAYLIYDRESEKVHYSLRRDHNAGRERVAMGILIAMYLQRSERIREYSRMENSLKLYYEFVNRELFDDLSGTVYNDAGCNNNEMNRLYNYAWVAVLHLEMFKLTGDMECLYRMVKTVKAYYM